MFGVIIAFKDYRISGGFLKSIISSKWVEPENFKFFLFLEQPLMYTPHLIPIMGLCARLSYQRRPGERPDSFEKNIYVL
jgi:hypothetical protein